MNPTFNEKLIAYLTLASGLGLSGVAIFYSVSGLIAIFAAAPIPIMIMGGALEISKLVATLWLKQNWKIASFPIKTYLITSISILMLITSLGCFGFLSKAHSDQGLTSGDVQAQIAVYDERIKVSKENIESNRKSLKQMDDSVDQILSRSTTEQGANRASTIRKTQQKERAVLQAEIIAAQTTISKLNDERAPIAAAVRQVEAEVGPIKYIAAFVYGATDQTILEKAVTWVIILIITVFDPMALILLIASQVSFQNFRNRSVSSAAIIPEVVTQPILQDKEIVPIEEPAPSSPVKLNNSDNASEVQVFRRPVKIKNTSTVVNNEWAKNLSYEAYAAAGREDQVKIEDGLADLIITNRLKLSDLPVKLQTVIKHRV